MLKLQHRVCMKQAWKAAGLLIIGMLLSACQADPTSEPSLNLATAAPATSAPTAASTDLPATQAATAPATPEPIAAAESTPTGTPELTMMASGNAVEAQARNVVMPILMYHHISDVTGSRYTTPLKEFREQMEYLKKEGYQTVTVSQVADAVRTGAALPEKPVALTFDDGYLDTYENAFPILKDLGYVGTVYIITSTLGTDQSYGYMQDDALKELVAAGWEIGSHGVNHTELMKSKLGAGNEMKQSKEDLETKLGIQVRSFSYPFAAANADLKILAAENGYDSAVGTDIINTHTPKRLYFLSRREVYRSLPLFGFEKLLLPSKDDDLVATLEAASPTPTPTP